MSECLFCKIVNNEVLCFQLFEDDLVKVFLDINPISQWHLLVIPKNHFHDIFGIPDEVIQRINLVCKNMTILCKEKLWATWVNILHASWKDAQQSIFHLHFHVVPRYENDELDLWFHGEAKNYDNLKEIHKHLTS